jgi:hypothetical protein
LQEWQTGIPLEEICRKYAVNAAWMYSWKHSLAQGLKESGDMVPKSQVLGLQKCVEELERALGRKALEADVLKQVFELKGLKLPNRDIRWVARTVGVSPPPPALMAVTSACSGD